MLPGASFIQDLMRLVPELKPIYDQHLTENDTLLPHVLMADLARFAVDEVAGVRHRPAVVKLLSQLENGLSDGDSETRELIVASFAENLAGEVAALQMLRPLMGPRLKKEVSTLCGT